jgi:hypothetical protein
MKEKHVFGLLKLIVWVIFLGLCVKTGALITSFGVSLWVNPVAAADLYPGISLESIIKFGFIHYLIIVWLIISISAMKAYLFFLLLKTLLKLDLSNPFEQTLADLMQKMSLTAFHIGITAVIIKEYSKWLVNQLLQFKIESGEVEYLFFAAILYVLVRIFKRGILLQSENELTI